MLCFESVFVYLNDAPRFGKELVKCVRINLAFRVNRAGWLAVIFRGVYGALDNHKRNGGVDEAQVSGAHSRPQNPFVGDKRAVFIFCVYDDVFEHCYFFPAFCSFNLFTALPALSFPRASAAR